MAKTAGEKSPDATATKDPDGPGARAHAAAVRRHLVSVEDDLRHVAEHVLAGRRGAFRGDGLRSEARTTPADEVEPAEAQDACAP